LQTALIQGFHLGDVFVEPLRGRVTDGAGTRPLRQEAMEVLLHLAARPGELVSQEELVASAWGGGDPGREALEEAVGDIRDALQDPEERPRFIQSMTGRGYRLVVEPSFVRPRPVKDDDQHEDEGWPLLQELARRGVVRAGITYLVVGWLLIQVADATFNKIAALPWWAAPFVTILVIIGFPVALVLAWFLEFAEGRWHVDKGDGKRRMSRRSRINYIAVTGALAVAAVSLTIYRMNAEDDSLFGEPPQVIVDGQAFVPDVELPIRDTSLAVLRFLNIDGSPETQVFADGLAEDLADRLARVPGVYVSSRRDAWSMPDEAASAEIRERLRVAYYLQGSVRLDDSTLRVVIELVNSEDGSIVLPRSFERVLDDLFLIQEQVTRQTVASLRVALPPETQTMLTMNADTSSVDAYVLYRKGKAANELPTADDSLEAAIGYFEQALAVDPEYAAAHAGLCRTYAAAFVHADDRSYIDKAEWACSAAVATNANLDLVHDALGNLYWHTGRDREAEAAYRRALEINEKDVNAMQGLAKVYARLDRPVEAEAMHHRAVEQQPGNWRAIDNLAFFYFISGRYAEAADQYRQVVFLNRQNWQGHGNLGAALMMAGELERAVPSLERSIEIEPHRLVYSNLGIVYYWLGRFDESVEIHRQAVDLAPEESTVWLNLGDALHFSSTPGQAAEAFRNAARLAERRLAVNPRETTFMLDLAWATAMLGDTRRSGELIGEAIRIAPDDPYGFYFLTLLETLRGREEEALDALETAVDKGFPTVLLRNEPYLEGIGKSRRYAAIVTGEPDKTWGGRR
jgi:tetratricopeptide (TPR) repeat protein/DNA-binding winged helix-turn-helix (wHTH) protein